MDELSGSSVVTAAVVKAKIIIDLYTGKYMYLFGIIILYSILFNTNKKNDYCIVDGIFIDRTLEELR